MDALETLRQIKLPFAELLGIRFVSAAPDRVVAEMQVRADLCTIPAVLHGGALMAFADTLGAAATFLNLPKGSNTTTMESKTNFLAAAPAGTKITGECLPVHRGRRSMVWQTRVTSQEGKIVGIITQTQMVLEPQRPPAPDLAALLKGKSQAEQVALLVRVEQECAAAYRQLAERASDAATREALLANAAAREKAEAALKGRP